MRRESKVVCKLTNNPCNQAHLFFDLLLDSLVTIYWRSCMIIYWLMTLKCGVVGINVLNISECITSMKLIFLVCVAMWKNTMVLYMDLSYKHTTLWPIEEWSSTMKPRLPLRQPKSSSRWRAYLSCGSVNSQQTHTPSSCSLVYGPAII